jgi:transglutaminase-like putative cysteine protease
MLIEAGFDIAFECPAQTPMLLQLSIHPSRDADLLTPDKINCDPILATRSYIDHFGNRVTRVEVPGGFVVFSNRFVIHDSGQPEDTPPDVDMTPIADLPDDVLLFLLQSRYCDSDKLADFAWSNFGMILGGRQRVQAICDFVHAKIRFSYPDARPTRSASDSIHEGIGVCRDFAHLAIALCRCMNIPARYCTGYLGDIGVPVDPNPMISAPGLRPSWTDVGTQWMRGITIPALGALSWDGVATRRTSRCRQLSESQIWRVFKW